MKKFVSITIIFLSCAGVILLVFPVGWFPSFYDVRYMGWAGIVGACAVGFLHLILRVPAHAPDAARKNRAADLFQFSLALALINNAIGDFGFYQLYKVGFEFDKLIHFSTSLIAVILIPIILRDRFDIRITYAAFISPFIVVSAGVGWEVYEYLADHAWGTHIFGMYGLDISVDTKMDILYNTLAAIGGTLYTVYVARRPFKSSQNI